MPAAAGACAARSVHPGRAWPWYPRAVRLREGMRRGSKGAGLARAGRLGSSAAHGWLRRPRRWRDATTVAASQPGPRSAARMPGLARTRASRRRTDRGTGGDRSGGQRRTSGRLFASGWLRTAENVLGPGERDHPCKPIRLGLEHPAAERRQAIEAAPGVFAPPARSRGLLDQSSRHHAADRPVERAGPHPYGAVGKRLDSLRDCVAVLLTVRDGEQDVEYRWREREEVSRPWVAGSHARGVSVRGGYIRYGYSSS